METPPPLVRDAARAALRARRAPARDMRPEAARRPLPAGAPPHPDARPLGRPEGARRARAARALAAARAAARRGSSGLARSLGSLDRFVRSLALARSLGSCGSCGLASLVGRSAGRLVRSFVCLSLARSLARLVGWFVVRVVGFPRSVLAVSVSRLSRVVPRAAVSRRPASPAARSIDGGVDDRGAISPPIVRQASAFFSNRVLLGRSSPRSSRARRDSRGRSISRAAGRTAPRRENMCHRIESRVTATGATSARVRRNPCDRSERDRGRAVCGRGVTAALGRRRARDGARSLSRRDRPPSTRVRPPSTRVRPVFDRSDGSQPTNHLDIEVRFGRCGVGFDDRAGSFSVVWRAMGSERRIRATTIRRPPANRFLGSSATQRSAAAPPPRVSFSFDRLPLPSLPLLFHPSALAPSISSSSPSLPQTPQLDRSTLSSTRFSTQPALLFASRVRRRARRGAQRLRGRRRARLARRARRLGESPDRDRALWVSHT